MLSPTRTFGRTALAVAGVIVVAACGAGDRSRDTTSVRDSAGIRIVENSAPMWAGGEGWRLAAEPAVSIGVVEGAPEYQLFEVADATRFPDGRIAVANGGSHEIRMYDDRGGFLRALGGEGGGPGEFRDLSTVVALPGDSILAFDGGNDRATVFSPDGEVARTVALRRVSPAPTGGFARLSDGTFIVVVSGWSSSQLDPEESRHGTTYREPSPVLRYAADGALLDTVGVFPGLEIAIWEGPDGGRRMGLPYFGHMLATAVHDDRIYIGTQERFEAAVYAPDGTLRRLIRGPAADLTIGEDDVAALRELLLASAPADEPDAARDLDRRLEAVPRPARRAAYERLRVDAASNLWVGLSDGWLPSDSDRWTVFDADGRMLGTVRVPEGLEIFEIGADYVLGAWEDEFEVEYVHLYELVKGR